MKTPIVLGAALLIAGALILGYGHFNYQTREKILEVGPIKATAERTETVSVPPGLAWALIVTGAGVLLIGVWRDRPIS
ncbi:MAG: hypothetical protein WCO60_12585 [Verrucomicrobiota bacterium]